MNRKNVPITGAAVAVLALVVASCGSSSESASDGGDDSDGAARPTIVVTTNILGDVVSEMVGDEAEVVTIMPVGADPHDFQASAQEVDAMMEADALIVNGAAFEDGLLDVIDNARDGGVPTFEAISAVDTIEFGDAGHGDDDDHDAEGGDEEDHDAEGGDEEDHDAEGGDEEDHDGEHTGADPHFFTDPVRMEAAVEGIVEFLLDEIDFADPASVEATTDAYVAELASLDDEVDELLGAIPGDDRVMVTNHEVFGYFADRYDFEIVGVVVPGGGTTDAVSAAELAELAEVIEAEGVPAIFADTSSSDQLAQTLADEVGDVAVVELYSESLGDADSDGATYLAMVRTNAERIGAALA